MNETASSYETLICPKCGFVQEQRLDCKKCGVVFSKYYALYPSTRPDALANQVNGEGLNSGDRGQRIAISDLQTQIRELNARLAEVEFEKAERNQLRSELKNLDKRYSESLEQTLARLERCEERFESFSSHNAHMEALDFNLAAVMERLEQLEGRVEALESANVPGNEFVHEENQYSRLLLELQEQLSALKAELSEIKSREEALRRNPASEESRSPLEEDVRAIRTNLDELKKFLGAVITK